MAESKKKVRSLDVKIDLDEREEGQSWGGKTVASAMVKIPLPADRAAVEASVGTILDTLIQQVTIFHGESVATAAEPEPSVPDPDALPF